MHAAPGDVDGLRPAFVFHVRLLDEEVVVRGEAVLHPCLVDQSSILPLGNSSGMGSTGTGTTPAFFALHAATQAGVSLPRHPSHRLRSMRVATVPLPAALTFSGNPTVPARAAVAAAARNVRLEIPLCLFFMDKPLKQVLLLNNKTHTVIEKVRTLYDQGYPWSLPLSFFLSATWQEPGETHVGTPSLGNTQAWRTNHTPTIAMNTRKSPMADLSPCSCR